MLVRPCLSRADSFPAAMKPKILLWMILYVTLEGQNPTASKRQLVGFPIIHLTTVYFFESEMVFFPVTQIGREEEGDACPKTQSSRS